MMRSIASMLPEDSMVVRDGLLASLPASILVPGDIVRIRAGNKLPADLRFLEVSGDARFDRSILTGESLPLTASVESTDNNYLETHNIGLQGSHCVAGSCVGLVVATGDGTVFGRIAQLTGTPKTKMTTLEREVLFFVIIICSIMFTMVAVVLVVWGTWLRKEHPDYINVPLLIVSCVSVAIAFIPEGLPIALTSGLTITANLMRRNNVLCKSLKTVETLGSVSVICSDKTGTLTQNCMTVTECTLGTTTLTPEEAADELAACATPGKAGIVTTGVGQLRALSALCNAAEYDATGDTIFPEATTTILDQRHLRERYGLSREQVPPNRGRRIHGDATDQAVLRFSESLGSTSKVRQGWKQTYELAFSSKNKYMIRAFTLLRDDLLSVTLPEREASEFQKGST